jgi:hypothetical protein
LRIKLKLVSLTYTVKVEGEPKFVQPTLVAGQGKVIFGDGIIIGNTDSENYFNFYSYIESRKLKSKISRHFFLLRLFVVGSGFLSIISTDIGPFLNLSKS